METEEFSVVGELFPGARLREFTCRSSRSTSGELLVGSLHLRVFVEVGTVDENVSLSDQRHAIRNSVPYEELFAIESEQVIPDVSGGGAEPAIDRLKPASGSMVRQLRGAKNVDIDCLRVGSDDLEAGLVGRQPAARHASDEFFWHAGRTGNAQYGALEWRCGRRGDGTLATKRSEQESEG
jgi:hypothetical protein